MYGLLLESIYKCLVGKFGEDVTQDILQKAGVSQRVFTHTRVYSESIVSRLTHAAQQVTGQPVDEAMTMYGMSFVVFVEHYGYDRILKVLGRNMRDFINGLDNLHEYLKFTYPKLKPPSFFCENETKAGLTLHYRSRRKGFLHYVMGQIKTVGTLFYDTQVDIEVLSEDEALGLTHVVMQLKFDNSAYEESDDDQESLRLDQLKLNTDVFFDVFPFHVMFDREMTIQSVGSGLAAVMADGVGHPIDEMFNITRPLMEFTLENLLVHTNNVFELTSVEPVKGMSTDDSGTTFVDDDRLSACLTLKGQMMSIPEWDGIVFLATPVMENLDRMFQTGLYINDLSMHDCSRDLVLAATQRASELKLALDQEKQKGQKLEESMRKLDEEMKRTDSLLYQMIPKTVADRLRNGEPAVSTCEVFESVTILFSDVVGFTRICSQLTPMGVVSMLNEMYTKFDKLSDKHRVYKVETIGDAYMVVAGAPTVTKYHASRVAEMAFGMLAGMSELIDPSTGKQMQIRIGLHSGTVVAGVVGLKMPRYCLFGEAVNIASKMENNGETMKINVSEATKTQLDGQGYSFKEHGTVNIKGSFSIRTFWLTAKRPSVATKEPDGQLVPTTEGDLPTIIETDSEANIAPNVLYKPVLLSATDIVQKNGGRKSRDPSPVPDVISDIIATNGLSESPGSETKLKNLANEAKNTTSKRDKLAKKTTMCSIS